MNRGHPPANVNLFVKLLFRDSTSPLPLSHFTFASRLFRSLAQSCRHEFCLRLLQVLLSSSYPSCFLTGPGFLLDTSTPESPEASSTCLSQAAYEVPNCQEQWPCLFCSSLSNTFCLWIPRQCNILSFPEDCVSIPRPPLVLVS